MDRRLQPPDPSAFLKRNRSADSSARSTPAAEKIPSLDDLGLPRFLRQSEDEIKHKFEQLDEKQRQRLDGPESDTSEHTWTQTASKFERYRNRYVDIRPWDRARVKLRVPEGCSDYINASPIILSCSKTGTRRRYIATQGPKEASVDHFWQMVWHETDQHAVIIMLTQLTEGLREKCFKYYPDDEEPSILELSFTDESGEELAAEVEVTESEWHDLSRTTIRTLQLRCQDEFKTVHHLFFEGWPDFGVPLASDRMALLELIKLSRTKNLGWENPRIVHCSAGVGRTGSFIAVEHLLEELGMGSMDTLAETVDPVFDTVEALRQQRMTMVQSEMQFKFIYDLLAEATRARLRERSIADGMKSMSTGMLSPGLGEPAHKAMRFSRVKEVWSSMRSRSTSRQGIRRGPNGSEVPSPLASPMLDRPESNSDVEAERPASALEQELGTSSVASQATTTDELYHDAHEVATSPRSNHSNNSHSDLTSSIHSAVIVPEIVESTVESQLPDAPLAQEEDEGDA